MVFGLHYQKGRWFAFKSSICFDCRAQWPCGLRRRSSADRLLRLWVRIPPGAWMFSCCECCVLSGRGLCDELITHPEESYRLCCIVVCDQETSKTRRLKPATGLWKTQPQWVVTPGKQTTNKNLFRLSKYYRTNIFKHLTRGIMLLSLPETLKHFL